MKISVFPLMISLLAFAVGALPLGCVSEESDYSLHTLADGRKILVLSSTTQNKKYILISEETELLSVDSEKVSFVAKGNRFAIYRPRPSIVSKVSLELVQSLPEKHEEKIRSLLESLDWGDSRRLKEVFAEVDGLF